MVRKGSSSKPKNSNTGSTPRRAPAAEAAAATAAAITAAAAAAVNVDAAGVVGNPLEPGPVQVLKRREELGTVELYDTYPLQSETDPLIGGTVELEESDKLSDVSILTNPPSEAGELADCYIVDPPQTLPEEIFDISELLETPEPLVTPDRYVLPYMKVVDWAVADAEEEEGEEEKKVVTNPFDTGLDQLSKRENLISHLRKVNKNDSRAVARDLANIDRLVNEAEAGNKVNKRAPKKKRKDENALEEDEKTCKDTPKKKKQKKATTKDAVKTAPPPVLGAAPSSTPPLPSTSPPPVDPPREQERCVSPLIGLTHGCWPRERRNDPNPLPARVFYCKSTKAVVVQVFGPPVPVGVSEQSLLKLPHELKNLFLLKLYAVQTL